jgi:hypothetical protein
VLLKHKEARHKISLSAFLSKMRALHGKLIFKKWAGDIGKDVYFYSKIPEIGHYASQDCLIKKLLKRYFIKHRVMQRPQNKLKTSTSIISIQ